MLASWAGLGVLFLIAGIVGAISSALERRNATSFVASVLVALVGAVVAPFLARQLQIAELINLRVADQPFPLVSAVVGSVLAVGLVHMMSGWRLLRN
jgi:uncharacterized membrane protein YeaQ/YmgE (transglycosylase-associated protein family)